MTGLDNFTCSLTYLPEVMANNILLLRAPTDKLEEDEYHIQLSSHGYSPHSISPLDTQLQNIDHLTRIISSTTENFDGVIITSSRSIEAWIMATNYSFFHKDAYLQKWKDRTFYVVGSKTASFLDRSLIGSLRPSGIQIKGAVESGNAEKLAEFILKTVGSTSQRLLYLTGDKNRDSLANKLKESKGKIDLVSLQVYSTCERPSLHENIEQYGEELRSGQSNLQPPPIPLLTI
jgi:uroporphyrinogen-III synthase